MKTIHMDALNIDVPNGRYNYFDLGMTKSLDDKIRFIAFKHNMKYIPPHVNPNTEHLGHTVPIEDTSGRFVYIYYRSLRNPFQDLRIRAHEETHALQRLNGLAYLQNNFDKIFDGPFRINIYDHDDETQACLGGWYAFIMAGGNLLDGNDGRIFNDHDRRALNLMLVSTPDEIFNRYSK